MENRNPYSRPRYHRLWSDGLAAGRDSKRSRGNNPGAHVPDRAAWLRGFEAGRARLRASELEG